MNWNKARAFASNLLERLASLSPRTEVALFLSIAFVAASIRLLFIHLLPTYLWSKDGASYALGTFHWLDTGEWMFSGSRGPVYTMLLAYCARLWGSFNGVVFTQHFLEWVAILFTILCARLLLGKRAAWIVYACGYAFAVCGTSLYYGHLIRNETLLFFFASMAIGSWALALKYNSAGWLVCAGLMAGTLTLAKNVFLPFPAMVLIGVAYLSWRTPRRLLLHGAAFIAAFAFPFGLHSWHNHTARWVDEAQPQPGILLFGRTAQWTQLDGGIEPEIKALIRSDIEAYRTLKKPDNNVIVFETAVPRMRARLKEQGRTGTDLDRLCRRLALEAIRTEPRQFVQQVTRDFTRIQMSRRLGGEAPSSSDIKEFSAILTKSSPDPHPSLQIKSTLATLNEAQGKRHFSLLNRWIKTAWLFQFFPVLLTSISLCWLVLIKGKGRPRGELIFWIGMAALWVFTMVLLSTVGRPMTRFLIPVLPVMFWVLTATLASLIELLSRSSGILNRG